MSKFQVLINGGVIPDPVIWWWAEWTNWSGYTAYKVVIFRRWRNRRMPSV